MADDKEGMEFSEKAPFLNWSSSYQKHRFPCSQKSIGFQRRAAGPAVSVSFPYDVTIVRILKQLHPVQRRYDDVWKKWAVDVDALDELIACFVQEFVPPSSTLLEAL